MILRFTFISVLGLFSFDMPSQQQSWCGTPVQLVPQGKNVQVIANNSYRDNKNAPLTVIPVVFHIVHSGQSVGVYPNIAALQIQSQIQVLNEDYEGIGYNWGAYPSSAFKNFALNQPLPPSSIDTLGRLKISDTGIRFCLATQDTLGNTLTEAGIDRILYSAKGWRNPLIITFTNDFYDFMEDTVKPQSIWNPTKYLNIWITDRNAFVGMNGYGTYPLQSGLADLTFTASPLKDGVWCYAMSVGSSDLFPQGQYLANKNKGRTCSHEVGHWLGLRHIWGDTPCGDDYCNDTPEATNSHSVNFIYPANPGSCTNNFPDGEMFMNIMDYTPDAFRYMFTPGQTARMQTTLANSPYRKFLGTHGLCSVPQIAAVASFTFPDQVCGGENQFHYAANFSRGVPVPNFSWTVNGNANISPGPTGAAVTISFPSPGIYSITLAAFNPTTSSITRTVQVLAFPTLTLTPSSLFACEGEQFQVTSAEAISYTWMPGPVFGSTYTAPLQTLGGFTLSATGPNGCISTKVVSVDKCLDIQNETEEILKIFPNPCSEVFYVELNETDLPGILEVFDCTGQYIFRSEVREKLLLKIDLTGENRSPVFFVRFFNGSKSLIGKILRASNL
jgi:hypothetical protein